MTNLVDEIDSFLLTRSHRERLHHYASDVTACLRQLYFKWTGAEETNPIEAGGYWKMSMGDRIHDLVHDFLEEAGYDIVNEVAGQLKHPKLIYPVSHRVDNLFVDRDGSIAGIEVKTTYGAGVKRLGSSPKDDHLAQVVMYMRSAGIDRFYLIYIGRDNGYRKQFLMEYTPEKDLLLDGRRIHDPFEELIDRLSRLEEHLGDWILPDRDYLVAIRNGAVKDKFQKNKIVYKSDWQCMYCRWKDACWKDAAESYKDSDNSEMFEESDDG